MTNDKSITKFKSLIICYLKLVICHSVLLPTSTQYNLLKNWMSRDVLNSTSLIVLISATQNYAQVIHIPAESG